MIQTKRGLLLSAALTIVVSLIILFPARIAYRWIASPEVAASGLHGTVWRGSAEAVAIRGGVLQNVNWRFRPLRLFAGNLAYRVEASPASGFVEGIMGIGLGGTLTITDLNAAVPLAMFADVLHINGLEGGASVRFERLKVRDGLPIAANGIVELNNVVSPTLGRDSIGGFRAEFFTQDNGVSASVEDTDAVLDLAGSLNVLADRSYQFIAQVAAKPATPESVRRQLRFLGSANDRGQYELRVEGSL